MGTAERSLTAMVVYSGAEAQARYIHNRDMVRFYGRERHDWQQSPQGRWQHAGSIPAASTGRLNEGC